MNKTVLVVDDHPLFRKALVSLLEETRACSVVIAAASAEEGLARVAESKVDLILLDLGLPGAAGVDAISLFRRDCEADILVVSASEHRQEVAAVLRAGASAVVSKSVSMDTLKDILRADVISRMTRHGFPAANVPSGTSRVTTLPAPMTAREPIRTPADMSAPPPTQTSAPISTGFPDSRSLRRAASIGCSGVRICTPGPNSV